MNYFNSSDLDGPRPLNGPSGPLGALHTGDCAYVGHVAFEAGLVS